MPSHSSSSSSLCTRQRKRVAMIHCHLLRRSSFLTSHYRLLIRSYTRLRIYSYTLRLYLLMSRSSLLPDPHILSLTLKALSHRASVPSILFSYQLHSVAIRGGLISHSHCESAFIANYCNLGRFDLARKLFDQMPTPTLGSWNSLIAGLSHSKPDEALQLFIDMRKRGVFPDDITMVSVNSACGRLGDFRLALQLHKLTFQATRNVDRPLHILAMRSNSIIDMYGKCGRIDLATKVFLAIPLPLKNVSSWTSMIVGHGMLGHADEAIAYFRHMVDVAGVTPNDVTFIGVLSACVHGGMVSEGKEYFNMMTDVYGMKPRLQHYGCMVDLLGRAGLLREAKEMIGRMPMRPNAVIFGCLLGACEKYGEVEMGEWAAGKLAELQPWNDGALVALSNIYAIHGMWSKVEIAREKMKMMGLRKSTAAYSI